MATMKIKKGDMVKVIAGKDKNKEGKVISINKKDNKVLVEGIKMVTKHAKPSMANQQGGILNASSQRKSNTCWILDGRRQKCSCSKSYRRSY